MGKQKFEIGARVALSPNALKECERREPSWAFETLGQTFPAMDPAARLATGTVVDYNGGYDVTWDDDCESLHGLYSAWWPPVDLKAITEEERRLMRRQMKREMQRREQAEREAKLRRQHEAEQRKELMNGFENVENIETAEWLFDHDNTPADRYVDAYYLSHEDLPDEEMAFGLKMADGIHVTLSPSLRILHKIRVRARSLRYAWGSCGFRKGFDVQYIFETDTESAAQEHKRIWYAGKDALAFILPMEDKEGGGWTVAFMPYSGHGQWSGTAVNLSFKGRMPFMLIDEPKGGFDTMLADGREVTIEPNKR